MRKVAFACLACLSACSAPSSQPATVGRGRYQGIGTYAAGTLWPQIAATTMTTSPRGATPADDEHVIVVVDGLTGEVRECGDYSGMCVSLSPWAPRPPKEQIAPVALKAHLADVTREGKACRTSP